ncbi:Long chain acyl-CoA synthetase 7, peroxisomal [Linum grandiflorum]
MESPAQRRLQAVQGHLLLSSSSSTDEEDHSLLLQPNLTASTQFVNSQTYSVSLPEKLQTGKWNVYRSIRSPLKIVSRFPEHPEIETLHDNFVHGVRNFRDYKYLGTRIRQDGRVGEFMWMTFGEAATAREAIGSGLRYHGLDKGVVLTHGNLISSVAGASMSIKFCSSDSYLSYLPLAHIYERTNQISSVYYGVAIGFYQGDNLKLMDDLAALRPTIFCSVPRLYNRIYDGITTAVKTSGALKERLFNAAFNSKKQAIMSGRNSSPMWDRLVFNKIKAKLGGRVRFMGSGASPLSPDVMDFLRVCFGCQVLEGYGMTETSCVISIMDEGDNLSGHVGSPNPACEVKLVDVPEMNYTSEDQPYPRGEICVRGPTIFKGYYKDETQTREVIDEDGWLHTGDIGLWLTGGRLKIIDRKKNIFKLAQGEYIAPEKIENVYTKSRFVAQCFIYGDSFNSSLVAIVSVDPDVLTDWWATSQGIKTDDLGQLCNDPRAKAAVLADMDSIGREAQLRGFEFAKAVTLVPEPFTLENGLLTPTFKIKRPQAKEYFAKAISSMYAELSSSDHPIPIAKL